MINAEGTVESLLPSFFQLSFLEFVQYYKPTDFHSRTRFDQDSLAELRGAVGASNDWSISLTISWNARALAVSGRFRIEAMTNRSCGGEGMTGRRTMGKPS